MRDVVKKYCNENVLLELNRLSNPYNNIEFQTTLHMIDKYFKNTGKVLDLGCGPGRYSIELLKKGYNVTLYDISNEQLKLAKSNIEDINLKADEYICGDCTDLSKFDDNSFDVVLLMGPMYHITDDSLRLDVLKNIKRILKDNGFAMIAYLNGLGIIKSSIHECSFEYANIENFSKLLVDNAWSKDDSFTETYVATPFGAKKEIEKCGLEIITYFGAEGFASGIHSDVIKMHNEDKKCYNNLVDLCKHTCELDEYRNSTEHIHFIVR